MINDETLQTFQQQIVTYLKLCDQDNAISDSILEKLVTQKNKNSPWETTDKIISQTIL